MKAHPRKGNKNSALLISVAESVGSTLGTLAAKANTAQTSITRSRGAHRVRRKAKKLMQKSKSVARKTSRSAPIKLIKNKRAKATRGRLRRA